LSVALTRREPWKASEVNITVNNSFDACHAIRVTACQQRQRVDGSCTSALWSIRSRYTFSRKGNTGRVLVRSSLYRFARTRDLCGPAAARMQHVTAASKANTSSCSDTYNA